MKKYVILFSIFFGIFFVLGFFTGKPIKLTDEKTIRFFVAKNSKISNVQGRYRITYLPDAKPLWVFDVTEGTGRYTDMLAPVEEEKSNYLAQTLIDDKLVATAVLGGAAGGWKIKDVVKELKEKKKPKTIIVEVLAGISGLSAGRWVASLGASEHLSSNIVEVLSKPVHQEEIKRYVFLLTYISYQKRIEKDMENILSERLVDKDKEQGDYLKMRPRWAAWNLLEKRLSDPAYLLKNSDFKILEDVCESVGGL